MCAWYCLLKLMCGTTPSSHCPGHWYRTLFEPLPESMCGVAQYIKMATNILIMAKMNTFKINELIKNTFFKVRWLCQEWLLTTVSSRPLRSCLDCSWRSWRNLTQREKKPGYHYHQYSITMLQELSDAIFSANDISGTSSWIMI